MARPMTPMTYQMGRGQVRGARGTAVAMALMAAASAAIFYVRPIMYAHVIGAAGVALFSILAFLSFRVGRSLEIDSIETSSEGIRRAPGGEWIPWSSVVGLRERRILKRIDLMGPGGATGISLDYDLDGFPELLSQALERMPGKTPQLPCTFREPLLSAAQLIAAAVFLGLIGCAAWYWIATGERLGLVVIIVLSGCLLLDRAVRVSKVTVADGFLTIRRGFRTKRRAIASLTSVKLALREVSTGSGSFKYLDVFVESEGRWLWIRPDGADPFAMYFALRAVIAHAGTR